MANKAKPPTAEARKNERRVMLFSLFEQQHSSICETSFPLVMRADERRRAKAIRLS
jgi:hypothetical protein